MSGTKNTHSLICARVPERFRERQWTRVPGRMTAAEFAEDALRLSGGGRATEACTPLPAKAVAFRDPARGNEGFGVAVLPFKYRGNNADLLSLAEALSEEIVTGRSRFSYLRVIARGSTSQYASEETDVRTIARKIGARYVMEGNLQQAGTSLRVAVQLVDTASGAHLWAETYT